MTNETTTTNGTTIITPRDLLALAKEAGACKGRLDDARKWIDEHPNATLADAWSERAYDVLWVATQCAMSPAKTLELCADASHHYRASVASQRVLPVRETMELCVGAGVDERTMVARYRMDLPRSVRDAVRFGMRPAEYAAYNSKELAILTADSGESTTIKPIYIRVEYEVSKYLPEYLAYLTADSGHRTPTSMRVLLSAFRGECRYVCPLSVIEGLSWPIELSDYDRMALIRDAREKITQWTADM